MLRHQLQPSVVETPVGELDEVTRRSVVLAQLHHWCRAGGYVEETVATDVEQRRWFQVELDGRIIHGIVSDEADVPQLPRISDDHGPRAARQ